MCRSMWPRQRYEAGLLAEAERSGSLSVGVHLLDDGFQHRQLHRDVDILLLNRADWQDSLLPAGQPARGRACGQAGERSWRFARTSPEWRNISAELIQSYRVLLCRAD